MSILFLSRVYFNTDDKYSSVIDGLWEIMLYFVRENDCSHNLVLPIVPKTKSQLADFVPQFFEIRL